LTARKDRTTILQHASCISGTMATSLPFRGRSDPSWGQEASVEPSETAPSCKRTANKAKLSADQRQGPDVTTNVVSRPTSFLVPFLRDGDFVKREAVQEELDDLLAEPGARVALCGPPGAGSAYRCLYLYDLTNRGIGSQHSQLSMHTACVSRRASLRFSALMQAAPQGMS
jgi:hypothetical protein